LVVHPLLSRRSPAFDVRLDDYVVTRHHHFIRREEDLRGLGPILVVPEPLLRRLARLILTVPRIVDDPLTPRLRRSE
jgi:hypothetical protein